MRWQLLANRGDPLDRMWARRLHLGGYECQTLDGDEIGIMPRNIILETYQLAATYIGDDFDESKG